MMEKPADAGSNANQPLKFPPGAPYWQSRCRDFTHIIVVTGTPGVGKSKFSKLLAKRIGAFHIDIGKIALNNEFTLGLDKRRKTQVADTRRISKWIEKFIREKKIDVIVDGHYASTVVPREKVKLVVVLRCDPRNLEKRLKRKGFPKRKIAENITAEILDICLFEALEVFGSQKIYELDTTNRTLNSMAHEVSHLLEGKIRSNFGHIDWLKIVEKKGELTKIVY